MLKLAFTGTRASNLGTGAVAFADHVQATSNGRLRVDLYPGGEAGGEVEAAQDMRSGALDMVYGSSAGYGLLAPELGVYDIPFLFRSVAHARAVLDGPIGQASIASLSPSGAVGLAWGENGLRHITTAAKPVRTVGDLAGLKIRVPQSPVMLAGFRAMGADAQPLPFPDLYGALASGQFQAQENPLMTIRDSNFDRVQKYVSLTGHVYSAALLTIGKGVFDSLAPADARILRDAALIGARASRDVADKSEKLTLAELQKRGMIVNDTVDRASFETSLSGAKKDFADRFGADRLAAIQQEGI